MKKEDRIKVVKTKKNVYKILFIITLSLALVGSGLFSYFLFKQNSEKNTYATAVQNSYTRNFTELSSSMNEIDVNLSKLLATSTSKTRQELLLKIWRDCSSCQTNLSSLPINHESVSNTLSFINKLGEYCYYLSVKLIEDESFSNEDFLTLEELSQFSNILNYDISLLAVNVANGNFDVLSTFNGSQIEELSGFLDNLNNSTVETPTMIYDGPFSENTTSNEIKGLSEEVCTQEQAKTFVATTFQVEESQITYLGNTKSIFETYNYEFITNDKTAFVQIAKRGKFLLQYNKEATNGTKALTKDEAINLGKEFFNKIEIKDMEANWINITQSEILINFAPVIENVVIYSDLIKIKIDRDSGQIIGYEAVDYALNHINRTNLTASITQNEAKEILSEKLNVENSRLCIIPKEYSEEVLAFEFTCSYNDNTYYVYINAQTGEEEQVFRVVNDENQGQLVM